MGFRILARTEDMVKKFIRREPSLLFWDSEEAYHFHINACRLVMNVYIVPNASSFGSVGRYTMLIKLHYKKLISIKRSL